MTAPPELHRRLLRPLNTTGVPYMVTGGLAAIIYGEPRLTNDVDIVLGIDPADAQRFVAAFPPSRYYVPPLEAIQQEAARRTQKLRYHRESGSERHPRDIAAMLRISAEIIDQPSLES